MEGSYLFHNELIVESKGSNQGVLDAVRMLKPGKTDTYYLAFDIVYDNMDVVNKALELQELAAGYPGQIILLDMICFEYLIFVFNRLIEWTGNGHRDVIHMRKCIMNAMADHRIDLDAITDTKTKDYLKGFKRYSTERVIKSMTYLLTDGDEWGVKGDILGRCWHKDCCILARKDKRQCCLEAMTGAAKMLELLSDSEVGKIISAIR